MKTYGEAPETVGSFVIRNPALFKATGERVTLRQTLIDSGFHREESTIETCEGVYNETWTNGTDEIEIRWKARATNLINP